MPLLRELETRRYVTAKRALWARWRACVWLVDTVKLGRRRHVSRDAKRAKQFQLRRSDDWLSGAKGRKTLANTAQPRHCDATARVKVNPYNPERCNNATVSPQLSLATQEWLTKI